MNQEELAQWFDANKTLLETAYLAGQQPWQQKRIDGYAIIMPMGL